MLRCDEELVDEVSSTRDRSDARLDGLDAGPDDVVEKEDPGPSPTRRSRWRAVRWALGTLIALALVVEVVAGRRQLAHAARAVSDPDWRWLAAALLVDVLSMVAFGGHQFQLMRGAGVAVRRSTATSLAFAAHSLSITLPGGPVFSSTYNYRRMAALGAPRAVASWVIAVSATLSAVTLALIGAGAGLAAGARGDLWHLAATTLLVAAVAVAAKIVGSRPRWIALAVRSSTVAAQKILRRDTTAAVDRLSGTLHQLLSVRIPAWRWALSAGAALANWLLDALCLSFCLHAVGASPVGVVHLLLVYTAGMAAASFPIIPAGLGVVDAALTVGLVAAGVSTPDAVAADVLFRVVSLGVVGGSGWALWSFDRRAMAQGAAHARS